MIQYRKILEMAQEGLSLRTVSASTGHGRPKVTEILQLAKEKGLEVIKNFISLDALPN